MSQRKLFGTDGIRGRANVYPMTGEVAFSLGRAVTAYFQKETSHKKPTIIIGKDTRLSCYMLEQAFSAGVCSQGGRAILTGPLPTPGVAFVTVSMRADAGIMISASHNSFNDNGIKIFDRNGHKLPDNIELELEKMILNPALIPTMLDDKLGNAKRLDEVVGRYIVQVKSALSQDYSLEGMRLVIDSAHGAAYKVAPMVFEELGAEVVALGTSPNGRNINDEVGALHPNNCAQNVLKYRADLGICLDGDADRIVIIDSQGQIANGDRLLGVLANYLKQINKLGKKPRVVGTVMSNMGLESYCKNLGIEFDRTKVGDRYIMENMRSTGAKLGGESSGHIILRDFATTGDGILAALKVIECIKYFKKPLSELVEDVPLYPQKLINVSVSEKVPFEKLEKVKQAVSELEKELKDEGRILLRYSGTENLARVMVEGKDNQKVEKACMQLAQVVASELKGQVRL